MADDVLGVNKKTNVRSILVDTGTGTFYKTWIKDEYDVKH